MQIKSIQSIAGCIKGSRKSLHQFWLKNRVWMLSNCIFIAMLVAEIKLIIIDSVGAKVRVFFFLKIPLKNCFRNMFLVEKFVIYLFKHSNYLKEESLKSVLFSSLSSANIDQSELSLNLWNIFFSCVVNFFTNFVN